MLQYRCLGAISTRHGMLLHIPLSPAKQLQIGRNTPTIYVHFYAADVATPSFQAASVQLRKHNSSVVLIVPDVGVIMIYKSIQPS